MNPALAKKAAKQIESCYLKEERDEVYVAGADIDFIWSMKQVRLFRKRWKENVPLDEIAAELGRELYDVEELALDQSRKGRIKKRPGGAYGQAV